MKRSLGVMIEDAIYLSQGWIFWYHHVFADHFVLKFSNWYQQVRFFATIFIFQNFAAALKIFTANCKFQFLQISNFIFFQIDAPLIRNSQKLDFAFFNLSFFSKRTISNTNPFWNAEKSRKTRKTQFASNF